MRGISSTILMIVVALGSDSSRAAELATGNGAHDFDFLYGQWTVHNRRLKQRLANSHEWVEFEAQDSFQALPGGLGSAEDYRTQYWPDFTAIGLHLYDPLKKQWNLYWGDNRNAPGTVQLLASGEFLHQSGLFFAEDTFNEKPITVRITWRSLGSDAARWEQAFSPDHGQTWETNWTMDFKRLGSGR
jgi:hypothetical protein